MNPLSEAVVGLGGVVAASGGIVGAVAAAASVLNRPRAARALAAESQVADAVAASIIAGERLALHVPDDARPALILACADVLGQHLRDNPAGYRDIDAVMSWYDDGQLRMRSLFGAAYDDGLLRIQSLFGAASHPGMSVPLTAAACLLYATDLHSDRLMAAGDQQSLREAANLRIATASLLLNDTALLMLPGGYQLVRHRILGTQLLDLELQGVNDPLLVLTCPFCETDGSVYDQTRLGCMYCPTVGGLTRTVPAAWKGGQAAPKRQAPYPVWWHQQQHTANSVAAGAKS